MKPAGLGNATDEFLLVKTTIHQATKEIVTRQEARMHHFGASFMEHRLNTLKDVY